MKPNAHDQLRWNEGAIVATLGAANLIRHHDGRWELRGGSAAEPAAAREWSPLIQHAVTFPDAPLPATAPQPNASKEVHNRVLIADDDALVRAIQRLTSEDKNRHVRRITKRAFVTRLLDNTGS